MEVFKKNWKKVLPLLALAAIAVCIHTWNRVEQRKRGAEENQQKEALVQAAETLLAEQGNLFDQIAAVLAKQEEPLYIAWASEQGQFLVNGTTSPETLEPGFADTVQTFFAVLPGEYKWQTIFYRSADRALISIDHDYTYTHEYVAHEELTIMFSVSMDYDGAAWSVGTETYGLT